MLWDLDKTEIRSNLETGSEISLDDDSRDIPALRNKRRAW
jgi:hypothetical protein